MCAIALVAGCWWPANAGAVPLVFRSTGNTQTPPHGAQPKILYNCNVTATNMSFGTYDIFSATPLTSTATATVTCNYFWGGGNVTVTFSTGSGGSFTPRTMSNGTNTLDYNIYADANHTQILGDGTNGTVTYQHTFPGGFFGTATAVATMYGQIPAQQNIPAGTYNDVITITLIIN